MPSSKMSTNNKAIMKRKYKVYLINLGKKIPQSHIYYQTSFVLRPSKNGF